MKKVKYTNIKWPFIFKQIQETTELMTFIILTLERVTFECFFLLVFDIWAQIWNVITKTEMSGTYEIEIWNVI